VEIGRTGPSLLPAVAGFAAEDRPDGPVVSLSYYIFPAFARLGLVAPEFDWEGLSRSGLHLIEASRFGEQNLPVDWISLNGGTPHAADGFPASFAFNSIRIPLYLAWSGIGGREIYEPFLATWSKQGMATLDVNTGRAVDKLDEPGYRAIPALAACVTSGTAVAGRFEIAAAGGQLLFHHAAVAVARRGSHEGSVMSSRMSVIGVTVWVALLATISVASAGLVDETALREYARQKRSRSRRGGNAPARTPPSGMEATGGSLDREAERARRSAVVGSL
jgi:hypothetical protein